MKTYCAITCYLTLIASALAGGKELEYFDPDDRRVHATVHAEVINSQLRLSVSAIGAGVEPLEGFRGRAGSNLQTAFEIDQLFGGDRLEVITTDPYGNRMADGYLTPGERGRIPLRRLSSDGTIDFDALSDRELMLSFKAESSGLPAGTFRTELWARGEPRLRVDYSVDENGSGSLVDFVEIEHGEQLPDDAGEQFRYVGTEGAADAPVPVDEAAWKARDLDAKWILFKKSLDSGTALGTWVDFLAAEKDYDFLELVAMYEIDAFQTHGIGEKLKAADAPNWLRLVAWMRGEGAPVRGHGPVAIDGLLLDPKKKDVVDSWIRLHKMEALYTDILPALSAEAPKPKKVDVSKLRPPHDPEVVLKVLDAPDQLPRLDSAAASTEEGKVYLHQVLRAIDAVVIGGRTAGPWMGKLSKLRNHPEPLVRQRVYLAYTHVTSHLIPTDTLAVANDDKEESVVREAALLAHSYRAHFEIYPDLLDIMEKPDHPAWKAAVSRLGDLGDGFALTLLEKIPAPTVQVEATIKQVAARVAASEANPGHQFKQSMQRCVWMEVNDLPRAESYRKWLDAQAKKHSPRIQPSITKLAKSSFVTSTGSTEEKRALSGKMTQAMRELASSYIDTP